MTTRAEFLRMCKAHPEWGPEQLARALGCHSSYCRATAQRLGIVLPSSLVSKNIRRVGEIAVAAGITVELMRKIIASGVVENLKGTK